MTPPVLPIPATPGEVLAALAALPPGARIATDADNTLWSGDVGDEVVRRAATPPFEPWRPGDADFPWYMEQMEVDYPRGCRYSAEVLVRVAADEARPALTQAVQAVVRPRRWLIEGLQAARARGVEVWLVSASPRLAVEVGADLFGLQGCGIVAVDCLSAEPPEFLEPVPVGEGKVLAWRKLGLPPPDVALGDSRWDLPLLGSARVGLFLQRACDDPHCDTPADDIRSLQVGTP